VTLELALRVVVHHDHVGPKRACHLDRNEPVGGGQQSQVTVAGEDHCVITPANSTVGKDRLIHSHGRRMRRQFHSWLERRQAETSPLNSKNKTRRPVN
jgi:hypothetical protein